VLNRETRITEREQDAALAHIQAREQLAKALTEAEAASAVMRDELKASTDAYRAELEDQMYSRLELKLSELQSEQELALDSIKDQGDDLTNRVRDQQVMQRAIDASKVRLDEAIARATTAEK